MSEAEQEIVVEGYSDEDLKIKTQEKIEQGYLLDGESYYVAKNLNPEGPYRSIWGQRMYLDKK